MEKKKRVLRALRRETVDRPPVLCVDSTATSELAQRLDLKWPVFHQRAEEMARMALGALEILDFDAVRVPFCQTIEAEALGCEVTYKDFMPGNDKALYTLDAVPEYPEDFLKRGRVPELLEALRLVKREAGDRALVLGGVVGPLSIARALLDSVPLLKASLKYPAKIIPFMEIGKRASIEMALALCEAGADMIVIEDMTASPDLLHPKTYKTMVANYHRQVIEALPARVILHICGDLTFIAEEAAGTGAMALSIDPKADLPQMRAKVGHRMPLIGGVDTVLLSLGDPEKVRAVSIEALGAGINLLAPGCAIPPNTPVQNVRAMVAAAEGFKRAPIL